MVTISGSKRRRTQLTLSTTASPPVRGLCRVSTAAAHRGGQDGQKFLGHRGLYDPVTQARKTLARCAGRAAGAAGVRTPIAGWTNGPSRRGSLSRKRGFESRACKPCPLWEIHPMPADLFAFAKGMASDWEAAKSPFDNVEATLPQTPGGSQSGGVVVEAAPCEPKGTLLTCPPWTRTRALQTPRPRSMSAATAN